MFSKTLKGLQFRRLCQTNAKEKCPIGSSSGFKKALIVAGGVATTGTFILAGVYVYDMLCKYTSISSTLKETINAHPLVEPLGATALPLILLPCFYGGFRPFYRKIKQSTNSCDIFIDAFELSTRIFIGSVLVTYAFIILPIVWEKYFNKQKKAAICKEQMKID